MSVGVVVEQKLDARAVIEFDDHIGAPVLVGHEAVRTEPARTAVRIKADVVPPMPPARIHVRRNVHERPILECLEIRVDDVPQGVDAIRQQSPHVENKVGTPVGVGAYGQRPARGVERRWRQPVGPSAPHAVAESRVRRRHKLKGMRGRHHRLGQGGSRGHDDERQDGGDS